MNRLTGQSLDPDLPFAKSTKQESNGKPRLNFVPSVQSSMEKLGDEPHNGSKSSPTITGVWDFKALMSQGGDANEKSAGVPPGEISNNGNTVAKQKTPCVEGTPDIGGGGGGGRK